MSNMKNGFSTLNRWLGKKNKADKSTPNGKLSKSSNNLNLSVSTTNINETSQLEYNRITPLPVATSNTAFEQTFRITVLLPKDQLYVARLGARVPLSKLLELVCENKLLDATKFEFRNPVDPSQVYSCDLTIGAVGLSEIRLCHKSESYDSFNADEIVKMHRTPVIRDSLSSSEFSSRYSKHTTKTTSPYSSSNSLNSMDSTGMNCVRTPVSPPPTLPTISAPTKIAAPPRKKRAAPRPPSQTVILETTALVNDVKEDQHSAQANKNALPKPTSALPQKEHFISTPNLSLAPNSNGIDCNGNATNQNDNHNDIDTNSYESETFEEQSQVKEKNARNINGSSAHNLSSPTVQQAPEFPEPSPRKRVVPAKKKSAPAPPPRGSSYLDDNISIQSMTPSTPDSPLTPNQTFADATSIQSNETCNDDQLESPKPHMRDSKTTTTPLHSSTPVLETTTAAYTESNTEHSVVHSEPVKAPTAPKPVPRITTAALLNGVVATSEANSSESGTTVAAAQQSNVSKTMLNRTPTPEPRSLSSEPPECDSGLGAHLSELKHGIANEDDDTVSKQADSGIGEPVPSPIPDSLPSEGSTHECKSTFESSSDDDDMVKVYNFKLGTTLTKTNVEPKSLNDFAKLANTQTDSESNTPGTITQEATPNFSDSTSWNFSIPISPPPNFADARFMENLQQEKPPDTPITPKIKERPLLNFDALQTDNSGTKTRDELDRGLIVDKEIVEEKRSKMNKVQLTAATPTTPLPSPTTPLNDIVDELSAIINDNRMDTLIRKADEHNEIEAAKPNTLTNFSITTIAQQPIKPTAIATTTDKPAAIDRADSFESTVKHMTTITHNSTTPPVENVENDNELNSRSSSQTSLTRLEQNSANLNRRRSSSELSIGESPSLQSLEVIKTILNSRKNSLANSSDGESKTSTIVEMVKASSETEAITPKNETSLENTAPTTEHNKPKEIPKLYRYSGPPSINFSTWNERPKVQVAIKNEGDYIFGGKNADSQSAAVTTAAIEINRTNAMRNNRISMPASSFRRETQENPQVERVLEVETAPRVNTPPTISPKPTSPTKRMGIPEQDCQVPITVKPLRDMTTNATVEVRTNAAGPGNAPNIKPATKSTKTSITTVLLNGDAQQFNVNANATTTHTSTLPRSGATNRFSMPASVMVGPALLRSTSITQLEATKPKPATAELTAAPFGQNTLRKTGLKEKILAREAEEQQKTKMATATADTTTTSTGTSTSILLRNNAAQTAKSTPIATVSNGFTNLNGGVNNNASTFMSGRTLQSTKMELKLQNSTNVYVNQSSFNVTTSPDTKKSSPTVPPPPPPAPTSAKANILRSTKGSAATTPTSPDPRNQLLAAIRNFKRDELNRT